MPNRKARRFIYIGETNRSVYERGLEHLNDVTGCKTSSHMLRHLLTVHEEEEDEWENIKFGMKILKTTKTAFERQILESVLIQKARAHNIMNNKAEYNRCALPRLTAKLGERDMEKWREEDGLEHLQEATIEDKIRVRKKDKAKKRAEATRRREKCQPAKKSSKMDRDLKEGEETGYTTATVEESNTNNQRGKGMSVTPKKRKVRGGAEDRRTPAKNPKRKRMNENIKKYISCRKWREEEDQMSKDQKQLEGE